VKQDIYIYIILIVKTQGKCLLGRLTSKQEDNIRIGLRAIWCERVKWLELVQIRVKWCEFFNIVMNSEVP
jgi:hypothetical protein